MIPQKIQLFKIGCVKVQAFIFILKNNTPYQFFVR